MSRQLSSTSIQGHWRLKIKELNCVMQKMNVQSSNVEIGQQLVAVQCANKNTSNEKKRSETQTLRACCSKAETKKFAPPQTLFPGAQDGQNLISWRWSLPFPPNPVWWRSMHAISSYRGNRLTNTHINTQTNPQTGPITIHWAAKLIAQCNY